MEATRIPTRYGAELPEWVLEELADVPECLPTVEHRMRLVHRLAGRNYHEGTGGPFAAIVVEEESGAVVSAGVNLVLASGLSAAHAEVVALSLAQTRCGAWDLGGPGQPVHELVVNWRPCVQCYGAVLWSGVRRLVIAGEGEELERLTGFDEGPLGEDWAEQLEARGITVQRNVLRDDAVRIFGRYGDSVSQGGVTVYNARGAYTARHAAT
ncbi:nucleoside deaminase [Phytoactinopolyspora endophytica]|uniref:nucleoside deaminase n=1 Tax=Phytoactinopolyspora endophytica TaxID=1642495 RepID=UPI00197B9817|nr:nucleoside deaminase [Phytoactinopolyspora endophytica]